jgi:trehalose 6-phosphate synthase
MADVPDITREAQDRAVPPPLESRPEVPGSSPDKAKRPPRTGRSRKQAVSSHQPRLVVVSNRVPVPKEGTSKAGGLTVALEGALKRSGGLWFGWSGETVENPSDQAKVSQAGNITFAVLDLSQQDYDEYYAGFANRALWPVCHYRLDLVQIERQELDGYFRVNRAFAASLAPLLQPDDVIWVHDYHFIPLAAELRRLGF